MGNNRSRVFYYFLLAIFVFFTYRLFDLQVFKFDQYNRFADENAARITPIRAPRGVIYDRSEKVIVQNRPVFSLFFFPNKTEDANRVLELLSYKLGQSVEELKDKIANSKALSYQGIKLATNIPSQLVSKIKEDQAILTGVRVVVSPLREYPYKQIGIQLLGFIGEINRKELNQLEKYGYRIGDLVGKGGIEKQYDKYLKGVAGGEKMAVDAFGRPIKLVESLDPLPGNNVVLTVDQEMQKAVEEILGYKNGAVVVLDPNSGEILAMVSHPAYDPTKSWKEIDQRNHPFMNRALTAAPAGSIFKPIVLQAALENNIFSKDEQIICKGYRKVGNRFQRCWKKEGHGRISFIEGLVWSCDVAFYELGVRLGVEKISALTKKYGFGKRTGIDLPHEKRGLVPSIEWKKKKYRLPWYEGDTINYAIGQGFLLVTPLQMASYYGELAVGRRYRPYVVKKIINQENEVLFSNEPELISESRVSDEVKSALREVVRRGTGVAANVYGLPASGKTGTAENPGLPHAWFVSYAPYDKPEIVISVFIEHGEHGDKAPAYVTREILKWYKKFRLKRKIESEKPTYQYIDHGNYKEWIYPKSYWEQRAVATAEALNP